MGDSSRVEFLECCRKVVAVHKELSELKRMFNENNNKIKTFNEEISMCTESKSCEEIGKPYEDVAPRPSVGRNKETMTSTELIPIVKRDIHIFQEAVRLYNSAIEAQKSVLLNRGISTVCRHTTTNETHSTEPFQRNSLLRSTPINVKKKIVQHCVPVDLMANVAISKLMHKVPSRPKTSEPKSDTKSPSTSAYEQTDWETESDGSSGDDSNFKGKGKTKAKGKTKGKVVGRRLFTPQQARIILKMATDTTNATRHLKPRPPYVPILQKAIAEKFKIDVTVVMLTHWLRNERNRLHLPKLPAHIFTLEQSRIVEDMYTEALSGKKKINGSKLCTIQRHVNELWNMDVSKQSLKQWYSRLSRKENKAPRRIMTNQKRANKITGPLELEAQNVIRSMIKECNDRMENAPQWYGSEQLNVVGMEALWPHRTIEFVERNEWKSYDDLHVYGVIKVHGTDSVIHFFTSDQNVFVYIKAQLQNIITSRGCASWMDAFGDQKKRIDFDNIHFIRLVDCKATALMLKITSVHLFPNCFNVRRRTHSIITNGMKEFIDSMQSLNVFPSESALNKMHSLLLRYDNVASDSEKEPDEVLVL